MRATLSSTASGKQEHEQEFAAPSKRNERLDAEGTPQRRREDQVDCEKGESWIDLNHEAAELLNVLRLSSTLLELESLQEKDRPALGMELMELVDRSWLLLEHLLESGATGEGSETGRGGQLFLQAQIFNGARHEPGRESHGRKSPGLLTDVRAEAGHDKRGMMLEETVAGWIAC